MDDVIFERHALDDLASDSISEDDVHTVIGEADVEHVQHSGHTRCERMMDDGRYLVVLVDEDAGIVKTAWWSTRASRRPRR